MNGLFGGRFDGGFPDQRIENCCHARNYSNWRNGDGNLSLGIRYSNEDERGTATWSDGGQRGIIDGYVSNLDELGWNVEDVFSQLSRRPHETASTLQGGFVLVYQNTRENRHLVVTDKLGTRPVFHVDSVPVKYASSVATLLPFVDAPTVNIQAVNDMLLMGHLWGNHTLVEEIFKQRPATVLEADNGVRSIERYWKPDYTEKPPDGRYLAELVERYRRAVKRASSTLPPRAGLWLSGGLDSRTTASALLQHCKPGRPESLTAYTYDANPPTNDNPKIARQVARTLGIEQRDVPLTAGTVGRNFERIVDGTDGMLSWAYAANLSATYEIESPPSVLMEGMQGELLGDHLYRHHLSEFDSAVDSQVSSEVDVKPKRVSEVLARSVDPLGTFKIEATHSPEPTTREKVLDIHYRNYYSRLSMPSNRLMRHRTGTRVVHADGDYLEWCAKLPRQHRKGAIRARGLPDGGIPLEPAPAKLLLARRIDPDLAQITYERSKVKPSWPYPAHVIGFVGNVLFNRLRSKPTYGRGQLADFWIRDSETTIHQIVSDLVDKAASRQLFDGDVVREIYDEHMDGANNASLLARITTLEQWLGSNLH